MALTAYQTAVQNLIQPSSSPVPLIPPATLTGYINQARNRIATEGECVRVDGTLALVSGTAEYTLAAISLTAGAYSQAFTVRQGFIQTSAGPPPTYNQLEVRPYEYFASTMRVLGQVGTPEMVGQQGQGAFGTLLFGPVPNAGFTVLFDCVALPQALADDSTPEVIPPLWQDAVQFYAAWLGLMNLQRQADADMMFERYDRMMMRSRGAATPTVLPDNMPGGVGAQIAGSLTPLFRSTQRAA